MFAWSGGIASLLSFRVAASAFGENSAYLGGFYEASSSNAQVRDAASFNLSVEPRLGKAERVGQLRQRNKFLFGHAQRFAENQAMSMV
jgi:hypothetical protein